MLVYPLQATRHFQRIHYDDGSTCDIALTSGQNIDDWWDPRDVPEAKLAWTGRRDDGVKVGAYLMRWQNPHPDKTIVSIDFIKRSPDSGIPILLAVTAEKTGS